MILLKILLSLICPGLGVCDLFSPAQVRMRDKILQVENNHNHLECSLAFRVLATEFEKANQPPWLKMSEAQENIVASFLKYTRNPYWRFA